MMTMIGKGSGNGQRVRDEILNIMHRNKISEQAGHFYEQWH
jgi:alpha-glucan,water dikinase